MFLFVLNMLSKFSLPMENRLCNILNVSSGYYFMMGSLTRKNGCSLVLQERQDHTLRIYQYVLIQRRNSFWVYWSRQKMSELLMSFGPGTISWSSIFVKCHKISSASVSMFIYVGRIGIIPVLFKLLPKDAFRSQFLLKESR